MSKARPIEVMFHEIRANNAANAAASARFAVYFLKKNGERFTKPAWVERKREWAEMKAEGMRKANPNSTVVVVEL